MPLIMANIGEKHTIKEIRGGRTAKLHLEKLGFVVGAPLEIVCRQGGGFIVKVMESRIALGAGMASKIIV